MQDTCGAQWSISSQLLPEAGLVRVGKMTRRCPCQRITHAAVVASPISINVNTLPSYKKHTKNASIMS
jgi:hypothetical protein